jgi:hypothetical protein
MPDADYQTVDFQPIINFDASTLTGTYTKITPTGGFTTTLKCIFGYNSSTSLILLSTDGVTDRFYIPPSSAEVFDLQTNADGYGGTVGLKQLKKGSDLWARTSSNTSRLLVGGFN